MIDIIFGGALLGYAIVTTCYALAKAAENALLKERNAKMSSTIHILRRNRVHDSKQLDHLYCKTNQLTKRLACYEGIVPPMSDHTEFADVIPKQNLDPRKYKLCIRPTLSVGNLHDPKLFIKPTKTNEDPGEG